MRTDESKWTSVSLVIRSSDVPPEEVTALLDLEPESTIVRGSPVAPRSPKSMISPDHVWSFRAETDESAPLSQHFVDMLAIMDPRADALRELAQRSEIELFVGFASDNGQGGDELSHAMLERIARHPVSVRLDLYPPPRSADHATLEVLRSSRP